MSCVCCQIIIKPGGNSQPYEEVRQGLSSNRKDNGKYQDSSKLLNDDIQRMMLSMNSIVGVPAMQLKNCWNLHPSPWPWIFSSLHLLLIHHTFSLEVSGKWMTHLEVYFINMNWFVRSPTKCTQNIFFKMSVYGLKTFSNPPIIDHSIGEAYSFKISLLRGLHSYSFPHQLAHCSYTFNLVSPNFLFNIAYVQLV